MQHGRSEQEFTGGILVSMFKGTEDDLKQRFTLFGGQALSRHSEFKDVQCGSLSGVRMRTKIVLGSGRSCMWPKNEHEHPRIPLAT